MGEQLLSVGIDIGTSTTQLILSRLTLEDRATPFTVPRVSIGGREVLYRSAIHFTPLLSDTVIDGAGVGAIVAEEYGKSGFDKSQVDTGAVIITGETARKWAGGSLSWTRTGGSPMCRRSLPGPGAPPRRLEKGLHPSSWGL